ncbi:interferon alpha-inducible protein 27, mitochondrial isoform X2 [Gopherus evgoodei]|uniref:interferon alpha-inducible protein 27, mitochondrial isoform X2 n=1 Tax=Gopherus evgoodei TaxID=1825980 RepID=UPI0011D00EA8|nr:interferon alpha-inducible protein 27, mitochondrial isoform X2 [Gopherus evgoodei]
MRFGETSCKSAMRMSYLWTLAQAAQGANDTQVTDSEPHAANMLGVAFIGIPVVVGAAGFTGAGIAAGTLAAKMMSAAAIANGGGVAAGSTVAVLQSIGAAGLPAAAKAVIVSVGAAAGALL